MNENRLPPPFPGIPRFVCLKIFECLAPQDIPRCLLVNKTWNKNIQEASKKICEPLSELCKKNEVDIGNQKVWTLIATSEEEIVDRFNRFCGKYFTQLLPDTGISFDCLCPLQPECHLTFKTEILSLNFERTSFRIAKAVCILMKRVDNPQSQRIFHYFGLLGDSVGKGFYERCISFLIKLPKMSNGLSACNQACTLFHKITDNFVEKHIAKLENSVNPIFCKIETMTVHHQIVSAESLYLFGEGASGLDSEGERVELSWEEGVPLHWTGGHRWCCEVGFTSMEAVECRVVLIDGSGKERWEIIDGDPLKNRKIQPGKPIEIGSLCFPKF